MPRNISYALTTEQFLDESKDVTRRLGWKFLKPGDVLMACEKCQGIKAGTLNRLGLIWIRGVRREPLSQIINEPDGAKREGFPGMSENDFVTMFCEHMKCDRKTFVTRIEFKHAIRAYQEQELALAAKDGESFFLRFPNRWYADPRWGCRMGHLSRRYLKSETRGDVCLECHAPVFIMPPKVDTDADLYHVLSRGPVDG